MGWMASWVGVQGASKEALLEALGFEETGESVEPGSGESDFSIGDVGEGWLIVFSEDFDWATPDRVLQLSSLGLAMGLQFEDKVDMTSIACCARNGVELWRISHTNEPGLELQVRGEPPPAFPSIRDELLAEQENDDGVDVLHDLPLEVAKSVCGYRADDWLPPFVALKKIGAPDKTVQPPSAGGGGFLSRLFGRR